jgi:S1-C subfamily serine protease
MSDQLDPLAQFSGALAARVNAAKSIIASISLPHGRHLTGMVWRPDIVVTSEQSLPDRDEFEIVTAGGPVTGAKIAGRDPATNIAVLRLPAPTASFSFDKSDARTGAVAIAVGADGTGGTSARFGIINVLGPEWHSRHGGLIDQRIELDLRLARKEEGGPVFDVAGGFIGMTTFGPRGQVLVIPKATLGRIVPKLLKDGRVARGWLGVALQAVAVPETLREAANQSGGLMVMSIVKDSPAAQAGIIAGDIILSVNGTPTHPFRKIARHFGSESIGRKADLRVIRGGAVITVQTSIAERPAA